MAISASTFSNIGGAASDLFAGQAAASGARGRASGMRISAEGTRINAQGMRVKAQGDIAEAENYDLAAALARKNKEYTERSTEIQQTQLDRKIALTIGGQQADVAGAGLKASGSALDLLRDSASQGALAKHVLAEQGEITEAGYEEQAKSFDTMSAASRLAYTGEMDIARRTDLLAGRTDALADQTEQEGQRSQRNSWISAAIRGAAVVAGTVYGGPVGGALAGAAAGAVTNATMGSAEDHDPSLDS